jgi:hypothetical protein
VEGRKKTQHQKYLIFGVGNRKKSLNLDLDLNIKAKNCLRIF